MPNQTNRLKFLNEDLDPLDGASLRTFHNGHTGGAHEKIFYIKNTDPAVYYSNVNLSIIHVPTNQPLNEVDTNWSVKLMYGSRRPTEIEWDLVENGDRLDLADIGSVEIADTSVNHPVWIRVYCPGGHAAKINEDFTLSLSYHAKIVEG